MTFINTMWVMGCFLMAVFSLMVMIVSLGATFIVSPIYILLAIPAFIVSAASIYVMDLS